MHGAFTLVELLLVLALLSVVMAIAMPTLGNFFKGRALDNEGRRLLALVRHGQSRAVSEGVPMMLWIDEDKKRYGVEQEAGWDEHDIRAVEFKLDQELKIEVVTTNLPQSNLPKLQLPTVSLTQAQERNLPEIKFLPDGSIEEGSPPTIRLTGKDGAVLELGQSENRLSYELRSPEKE